MQHQYNQPWSNGKRRIREIGRVMVKKETERSLFFYLTLAMLFMGFLAKLGIW